MTVSKCLRFKDGTEYHIYIGNELIMGRGSLSYAPKSSIDDSKNTIFNSFIDQRSGKEYDIYYPQKSNDHIALTWKWPIAENNFRVSSRHARLYWEGDNIYIEDISRNGISTLGKEGKRLSSPINIKREIVLEFCLLLKYKFSPVYGSNDRIRSLLIECIEKGEHQKIIFSKDEVYIGNKSSELVISNLIHKEYSLIKNYDNKMIIHALWEDPPLRIFNQIIDKNESAVLCEGNLLNIAGKEIKITETGYLTDNELKYINKEVNKIKYNHKKGTKITKKILDGRKKFKETGDPEYLLSLIRNHSESIEIATVYNDLRLALKNKSFNKSFDKIIKKNMDLFRKNDRNLNENIIKIYNECCKSYAEYLYHLDGGPQIIFALNSNKEIVINERVNVEIHAYNFGDRSAQNIKIEFYSDDGILEYRYIDNDDDILELTKAESEESCIVKNINFKFKEAGTYQITPKISFYDETLDERVFMDSIDIPIEVKQHGAAAGSVNYYSNCKVVHGDSIETAGNFIAYRSSIFEKYNKDK